MKTVILVISLAVILGACGKSQHEKDDEYISGRHQNIIDYLKKNEEKVMDATWTSTRVLKVGVINDGTRRDGYAQYVCNIVDDGGLSGFEISVKVIDIQKLANQGQWETLGKATCQ